MALTKISGEVIQSGIGISVSSVGIGTEVSISASGINVTGVVTATSFSGDGSGLTGVAAAGLGSALSDDTSSPLNLIYKTPKVLNVGAAVSITVESDETSGYVAYMPAGSVHVAVGGTVRVALGTTVKTNILGVFD
jgi:hypothetical protein